MTFLILQSPCTGSLQEMVASTNCSLAVAWLSVFCRFFEVSLVLASVGFNCAILGYTDGCLCF